jgi:hypothetical protein
VSISTKEEFEDKRVKIGVLVVGEQAGLDKTLFLKTSPVGLFFFIFGFFGFFLYICPEESF